MPWLTHSIQGLDKVVEKTCNEFTEELGDNIFDKYCNVPKLHMSNLSSSCANVDLALAVSNAAKEASNTAYKWGMSKSGIDISSHVRFG